LRSPRLGTLLQEAREQYDYVLIDTPPLGPVSDCALLARWIDGVLLVVAANRTSRKLPRRDAESARRRVRARHRLQ
jgi:Mrp family chromosome partitioning ATPase